MSKNNNNAFQMIADIEGDFKDLIGNQSPETAPILPVRNIVLFPGVVMPILIGRESSKALVQKAERRGTVICVIPQKDPEVDHPQQEDLYEFGVYAKVMKLLTLPNGNVTTIVQGLGRMHLNRIINTSPYLEGEVQPYNDVDPDKRDREFKTAMDDLRNMVGEYVSITDEIPDEATFAIKNISNEYMALNFVCSNMPFSLKEKMKLLLADTVKERLFGVMKLINREINLQNLKADIRNKTREDIDEQQRNYFLQQQIKNMQAEMGHGESSPEKYELLKKAAKKKWSAEVDKAFHKEADKLDNLNSQSPEFNVQLTYLQTIVGLPWGEYTEDDLNLKRAQKILDHDHYGMEKVKERILEYMAVLALRGDLKSPIICLYGPPGVGKDIAGQVDRFCHEAQVRPHVTGWSARRGRDSWSPSYLYRCDAWPYRQVDPEGWFKQPCVYPRRNRQGDAEHPQRRPSICTARGARSRAELCLPRQLSRPRLRPLEGALYRHGQ